MTTKEIAFLERARTGLLYALAILSAADKLPAPDTADLGTLMGAARDLLGHHLEDVDQALGGLRAGGAA